MCFTERMLVVFGSCIYGALFLFCLFVNWNRKNMEATGKSFEFSLSGANLSLQTNVYREMCCLSRMLWEIRTHSLSGPWLRSSCVAWSLLSVAKVTCWGRPQSGQLYQALKHNRAYLCACDFFPEWNFSFLLSRHPLLPEVHPGSRESARRKTAKTPSRGPCGSRGA